MKFKTTNKELKEGYQYLLKIGYNNLRYLLYFKEPIAYNSGSYGWNYDVYQLKDNIAISTGYRPTGEIIPYELYEYNNKAEFIVKSDGKLYDKISAIDKLIDEFINELIVYKRGLE